MTLPTTAERDVSYRRLVLFVTTLGAFMTPLDGSVVSVALPTIAAGLAMSYAEVIWVPTAYTLCIGALLLTFGRLSDVKGRRRFFTFGFSLFSAASALSSLSQSGWQLILLRMFQGVGGAMVGATSAAIVTEAFPSKERGKALGVNTTAVYTGLLVGPTLGGLLVQAFGWRPIFYVTPSIGLVVVSLAALRLRETAVNKPGSRGFDLAGAVSFSGGLSLLLVALTLGGGYRWTEPLILAALVSGLGLLALFLLVERRRGEDALLDLGLFRANRLFAAGNLSALLNYTSFSAATFFISFYLQRVMGISPAEAGLTLMAMPVSMAALAPISGWLSDRFGSRAFASVGMALISGAMVLLSQLSLGSPLLHVLAGLFMLGVGMGLFSSPNTSAVMGSVEKEHLGVASGTLATMRSLGQSLSLAIMAAVAATVAPPEVLAAILGRGGEGPVAAEAFIQGLRSAFSVGAIIALGGTFTSIVRGKAR
ncbi:MAG: MFS transporter [Candidatus Bathyarchaeia archaeon]